MTSRSSKVQQFLLNASIPVACSVVTGYLFYQEGIFTPAHSAFQFVWSAVVASAFYNLLVSVRRRDAFIGLFVLFCLTLLTTRSTHIVYIIRDIFYVGAIGASMLLYVDYFKRSAEIHPLYPAVTISGIYALLYILVFEIHLAIVQGLGVQERAGAVSVASSSAMYGVLIGFAVGAGITIAERLFGRRGT